LFGNLESSSIQVFSQFFVTERFSLRFHENRAIFISTMRDEIIELSVKGIALEEESQMPILILKDKASDRLLPISVGPFEASAIIIELQGIEPPRPLTHDILAEFFQRHGFQMLYIEIYGVLDHKHTARMLYRKGFKNYSMEIRPSDGIALALRLNARICSSDKVMSLHTEEQASLKNLETLSSEFLYLEADNIQTPLM